MAARAECRSWDAAPKEEQSCLQANESRPDGPAEPCVCMAACQTESAFRLSKMIVLNRSGSGPLVSRGDGSGGTPAECLSSRGYLGLIVILAQSFWGLLNRLGSCHWDWEHLLCCGADMHFLLSLALSFCQSFLQWYCHQTVLVDWGGSIEYIFLLGQEKKCRPVSINQAVTSGGWHDLQSNFFCSVFEEVGFASRTFPLWGHLQKL